MRLKTKFQDEDFELGEVVDAGVYHGGVHAIKVVASASQGGDHSFYYDSLESIYVDWEDYEDPKKYWFIDAFGNIVQNEITEHCGDEYIDMADAYERQKQIGNYFESEEEAKQAVEKLKAWKRLKDRGFRFGATMPPEFYEDEEVTQDLIALFGGEE